MQESLQGKSAGPNHTRKLGNREFSAYLKSMPKLSTLIFNIEKHLQNYDRFYLDSLLSLWKGRDLDTLEKLLSQQYQKLVAGKSFLHKINNAVASRQKCLQKIKRELTKVQGVLNFFKKAYFRKQRPETSLYLEYVEGEGYSPVEVDVTVESSVQLISSMFTDMSRLRDMTIYLIHSVHEWRVQVESWMDQCGCHARVDYWVAEGAQSARLYERVQTDTDFIWDSLLSEYIWLQFKRDPLLIRNAINVSERADKQPLEKYFVEQMYPQDGQLIDRTIKALDMLEHVYKPVQPNLFAEEERLIQTYLELQRQKNYELGLDQNGQESNTADDQIVCGGSRIKKSYSESRINLSKGLRGQIQHDHRQWNCPYGKVDRGLVFGNIIKKPTTDRIREIVQRHQIEGMYMANHKNMNRNQILPGFKEQKVLGLGSASPQKNNAKGHNMLGLTKQIINIDALKGLPKKPISQDEAKPKKGTTDIRKMHHSLVKINTIPEDPSQHDEVPSSITRAQKVPSKNTKFDGFENPGLSKVRINEHNKNFTPPENRVIELKIPEQRKNEKIIEKLRLNPLNHDAESKAQEQKTKIEVESEETQLNLKQFYEVFRADTREKVHAESRVVEQITKAQLKEQQVKSINGGMEVAKEIDNKRSKSIKSARLLPYYKKEKRPKLSLPKKEQNKTARKSNQKDPSTNSFDMYEKVNRETKDEEIDIRVYQLSHISLISKQITKDTAAEYVKYLCSQVPVTCRSFTRYHTTEFQQGMVQHLGDATHNSLIFEMEAQQHGRVGQAVVMESLSTALKMRYSIQLVFVNRFEFLPSCVCRISEELLATTPCEEVVLKLVQDKLDPISTHFIAIIDKVLEKKAQRFCYFHVLEKPLLGLANQSLHERVYIFQSNSKNVIKEAITNKLRHEWRRRVAGSNYRSLVIEAKCLVMSSNFKMRSGTVIKPTVAVYKQESLGLMYAVALQNFMTKYHMKQLKIAALSLGQAEQESDFRRSPFLRTVFNSMLELMRKSQDDPSGQISRWQKSCVTKFASMTDLLNYLSYKQLDVHFNFEDLVESRFLLNHELILAELNLNTSLDFLLEHSVGMLILNNHHNYEIEQFSRTNQDTAIVMLPTTTDNLKIFFTSAKEFLGCVDALDLYSYVELLFKESVVKKRRDVEQLVIPDLTKQGSRVRPVRSFQGFMRLFPEREFFSCSMLRVSNLWQNFYPNAVIAKPSPSAVLVEYPLIVGFYDDILGLPMLSLLLRQ